LGIVFSLFGKASFDQLFIQFILSLNAVAINILLKLAQQVSTTLGFVINSRLSNVVCLYKFKKKHNIIILNSISISESIYPLRQVSTNFVFNITK